MKNDDRSDVEDDLYGIRTLAVAQLKAVLLNRGLIRRGFKQDLVAQLFSDIEGDGWETGIGNETGTTVINDDTVPRLILPDIIFPPQLPDTTVTNVSATDAPLSMVGLPDIVVYPQLPDTTIVNGSTTNTPLLMITLPDIILPPQLPDATVDNGSATDAPFSMVEIPDIIFPR